MESVQYVCCATNEMVDRTPDDLPLFYRTSFVLRNGDDGLMTYMAVENHDIKSMIHFQIDGDKAISLPMSPFGGVVVMDEQIPEGIQPMMALALDDLITSGVYTIVVRECPNSYSNWEGREQLYKRLGFENKVEDISQFLPIEGAYESVINRNRRRNLNTCLNKYYEAEKIDNQHLKTVWELLEANRQARGLNLTMSLDQLEEAFDKFPDRYLLFGVWNGEELIAASVCIKVNAQILYDFYHGELPAYKADSPVTLLVKCIYEFAQTEGMTILDLGVSTVEGVLDEGLSRYKQSLGALSEPKITYQFKL